MIIKPGTRIRILEDYVVDNLNILTPSGRLGKRDVYLKAGDELEVAFQYTYDGFGYYSGEEILVLKYDVDRRFPRRLHIPKRDLKFQIV